MKKANIALLKIIDCANGQWKFDIKTGLNEDDIRRLLNQLKYIEDELKTHLRTHIVPVTDTVAFITKK